MSYTVKELSKLAGVSVRTLHYYDEIGLLVPSRVEENGYRQYEEPDLMRLQQILFFRELDFSLEKIKEVMDSPEYNTLSALEDQKKLLEVKRKRLDGLVNSISRTVASMKGGEHMSNDDKFSAFNDPTYQQHKDEAEQRWGKTDAYKQSMERVGKMSREDLEKMQLDFGDINVNMAELMKQGKSADCEEVQEQIARHFKMISLFYDPSPEMYEGLGQMYVQDPRFGIHYESVAGGLAKYMADAMKTYAASLRK